MDQDNTRAQPLQKAAKKIGEKPAGASPAAKVSHIPSAEFPDRYSIRETAGEQVVTCIEAPNLSVHIKFGLSVSPGSVSKAAPGTIFLDGVVQDGPFLDNARQVYNFDHHEGCIRAFTLATCEQVLVMLKKGFDLRSREWKIIANDPDLDTVLAIWLLLNHVRISEQESIREHILVPLVRLEGAIDSLGLELKGLSALPSPLLNQSQRIIDHLRRKELRIKKDGSWEKTDFPTYTADMLHEIDQIMYEPHRFGDLLGIEELARENLPDNRVAVVLQSDMGIYEIEPLLKKIYGGSIGLAILRRSPNTYTLRQTDPFMSGNLEDVYEKLNFMDPAVKCRTRDKWGGSSDIGGSPREKGTQLSPEEIAKGCKEAFETYSFFQHLRQFFLVSLACAGALLAAEFLTERWHSGKWPHAPYVGALVSDPYIVFSVALIVLTTILLAGVSRGRLWQFGIILPEGTNWWFMLPITILSAFAGGVFSPKAPLSFQPAAVSRLVLACILFPFAVEYLFRGVLHGILAQKSKIQSCRSKFFISWPNIGTSLLYTTALTFLPLFHHVSLYPLFFTVRHGSICVAAFFFSISLGFARERSHSLFPSCLIHFLLVIALVFTPELVKFDIAGLFSGSFGF